MFRSRRSRMGFAVHEPMRGRLSRATDAQATTGGGEPTPRRDVPHSVDDGDEVPERYQYAHQNDTLKGDKAMTRDGGVRAGSPG